MKQTDAFNALQKHKDDIARMKDKAKQPLAPEREALIAFLKYLSAKYAEWLDPMSQKESSDLRKSADMLQADAFEIAALSGALTANEDKDREIARLQLHIKHIGNDALRAENARLLKAWDDTLAIANDAKPIIERLAAERDAARAELNALKGGIDK